MTDAARGHDEALPGGVQELARELGDLLRGGLGLGLARLGALRELVPQRRLDRLFPLIAVDLAVAVRVQLREGRLEARRDQQVLEVLVAAVREEVDHFFVCSDGGDAARESGGERRVASMAYERPLTARHRRDARRLKDGRGAQTSLPCRGSPIRLCQSLGKPHGPR